MTNRHIRTIALAVLTIIGGAASAQTQQQNTLSDVVEILGNVSSASRPVGSALVIALNLSTFYAAQTFSNETGAFRLPPLRAGVYRIITVKQGFTPAEIALARSHGCAPITLGPIILRVEPAAIYCLSILSYELL